MKSSASEAGLIIRIGQNLKPSVFERWSFTRGSHTLIRLENLYCRHMTIRDSLRMNHVGKPHSTEKLFPTFPAFVSFCPGLLPLALFRLRSIKQCCIISHYFPASQPLRTFPLPPPYPASPGLPLLFFLLYPTGW